MKYLYYYFFSKAKEAAKQTGSSQGNISNAATGRVKTIGGFIWRYIYE